MLNFYRKFLCRAAGVLTPLTDALRSPGKSLSWMAPGPPGRSCPRSFMWLRASTPPLKGSYLLPTLLSGTSDFSWKVENLNLY